MKFEFHHIGVISGDLKKSRQFYESLGYEAAKTFIDPLQMVEIVFMNRGQDPLIELVTPTSPESPAQSWLERLKIGPYHICYEVENLDQAILELRKSGLTTASKPQPAVAFSGRPVSFLWSLKSGLIEVLQKKIY